MMAAATSSGTRSSNPGLHRENYTASGVSQRYLRVGEDEKASRCNVLEMTAPGRRLANVSCQVLEGHEVFGRRSNPQVCICYKDLPNRGDKSLLRCVHHSRACGLLVARANRDDQRGVGGNDWERLPGYSGRMHLGTRCAAVLRLGTDANSELQAPQNDVMRVAHVRPRDVIDLLAAERRKRPAPRNRPEA